MKVWFQAFILIVVFGWPAIANAGAWPQSKGETQLIVSLEPGVATEAFDGKGDLSISLPQWKTQDVSVYADHGLSDRLTVTAELNYKDYRTEVSKFSGLTSVEVGARWTFLKRADLVVAVGAYVEGLGKGRRSDFDTSPRPGTDYSIRAYFGKSFKVGRAEAFVDVQVARYSREVEANQWRLDATIGFKPSPQLMILAQSFSGQSDKQAWGQSRWNNVQLSVVRHFGPDEKTSLQVGVRQTVAGRNVPAVNAVVVSLWKRF